jgi:two-component system chemotaxis response regulator CheY
MNVLLVDRSSMARNIQKNALASLGPIEFSEAVDGLEALTVIAATPEGFDVILLDLNTPHMDGLSLARKIRESDPRTPLIVVTAEADKSRVLAAIGAGVNDYVIKPFDPAHLLARVTQLVKREKGAA